MADDNPNNLSVELIDEQTIFTVADLCRSCSVEAEFIEALVEQGILEPTGQQGRHAAFASTSLRRARVTVSLQRDLGVNLPGAAVVLDLLERIETLHDQLRAAKRNQP